MQSHRLSTCSTINGEAWYGDSAREILNGVTAEQAQAHPIANAHSIWELVLHVEAWCKFCLRRGAGNADPSLANNAERIGLAAGEGTSEQAWKEAVVIFRKHLKLVEAIKRFSDDRLEATSRAGHTTSTGSSRA